MNFAFAERPFSGRTFRPRPEIHLDTDSKTLIIATPWGPREAARKVINRMTDYLALAREDSEATSVFQKMSCLSTSANRLRTATLLANETLFREDNREEYRSGVEIFAGILEEDEFVWLQSGNPQILLSRVGKKLLPLGSQIDLSFDFSEGNEILSGLPSQLMGLDSSLNLSINSFRAHAGDKLALISHSHLPEGIFAIQRDQISVDGLSRAVAAATPNHAFWVGVLQIGDPASPQGRS
ncbi:MAG: hypothetical protein EOP05_22475 [Proteobacteria bacterium]|nr:MAG: hypothetical protein EOP05_22475 [Pseudomonadota bacterium]